MLYLDEDFIEHPKVQNPGRRLGPDGAAKVVMVYLAGLRYAAKYLTDGFLPNDFIRGLNVIQNATKVIRIISDPRIVERPLWRKVRGGYQIHDYEVWNHKAIEIKKKRANTRRRMAALRARKRLANVTPDVTPSQGPSTTTTTTTTTNTVLPTGTSTSNVRASSPSSGTSKIEQRPNGRAPSSKLTRQREKTFELARTPAADGNYAVLVRLAHVAMEDERDGDPESPDVIEAVKTAAGRARIRYDSDTLHRALRSAATQRLLGDRGQAKRPLAPLADQVRSALEAGTLPATMRAIAAARKD